MAPQLYNKCKLTMRLLQYNELKTSTKLPLSSVVLTAAADWDRGGCRGEAAVGGFNDTSKLLWGFELFACCGKLCGAGRSLGNQIFIFAKDFP